MVDAKSCVICGEYFNPKFKKIQTCSKACANEKRRQTLATMRQKSAWLCVVCGAEFSAAPSDKTVTCSKECSIVHKKHTHNGKSNEWSEEARDRLSQRGQTNNLKLGTPAARKSPVSGPFETNHNAKTWTIKSPHGKIYTVRNLALFCRTHAELFAPDPPENAYAGLRQIASTLRNHRRACRPVLQWKGWTLEDVPVDDN